MCLEESFCPFTRDALSFRRRTTEQCLGYSPSAVITAPCDAPLYHSAHTAHAHRKS